MTVNRARRMGWSEYFKSFWTWIDINMLLLMILTGVSYALMIVETSTISDDVLETGGGEFIPLRVSICTSLSSLLNICDLQRVSEINFYFDTCQALVLFLATTKLIQSLKFNRRLAYIITSLNASKTELVGFSIYFALVYTAFCRLILSALYEL